MGILSRKVLDKTTNKNLSVAKANIHSTTNFTGPFEC